MTLPVYTVTCSQIAKIAHNIFELRFTKPANFTFIPGQFVMWQVPLVNEPNNIQPRAYSIASTPAESDLLFAFKYEQNGRASEWVQQLQVGDELTFQGPLGNLALHPGTKSLLLVCTSTGNAPFRSMLYSELGAGDKRTMDLVYGVRSERDLYWLDEFTQLSKEFPQVRLHIVLSQPSANWQGYTGRVQTVVEQLLEPSNHTVYACGNPIMTKEIKQMCLAAGLEKSDIHIEGYI